MLAVLFEISRVHAVLFKILLHFKPHKFFRSIRLIPAKVQLPLVRDKAAPLILHLLIQRRKHIFHGDRRLHHPDQTVLIIFYFCHQSRNLRRPVIVKQRVLILIMPARYVRLPRPRHFMHTGAAVKDRHHLLHLIIHGVYAHAVQQSVVADKTLQRRDIGMIKSKQLFRIQLFLPDRLLQHLQKRLVI